MRLQGTLVSWDDDAGFGLVAPADGGEEIRIRASAFPREGGAPRIGERLWFGIATDKDGIRCATAVARAAATDGTVAPPCRPTEIARVRPGLPARALLLIAMAFGMLAYNQGWLGPDHTETRQARAPLTLPGATPAVEPMAAPAFDCDGRTLCSQMRSCAEAQFFHQHCPAATLDEHGDGVPCKALCAP